MLDRVQTEAKDPPGEMQFPFNPVEAQERGTVLFSRLNELTAKTARAIWESQAELLHLEVEQAVKTVALPRIGEDPGATVCAYCNQVREQSDRMIAQMRRVNDLYKDYGWQLFAIYADGLRQAAKQSQASPSG